MITTACDGAVVYHGGRVESIRLVPLVGGMSSVNVASS